MLIVIEICEPNSKLLIGTTYSEYKCSLTDLCPANEDFPGCLRQREAQ